MQKVRGSNPLGPTIFDERGRKINFLLFYFFHGIHLVGTVVPTVRVCDTKQKGNEGAALRVDVQGDGMASLSDTTGRVGRPVHGMVVEEWQ